MTTIPQSRKRWWEGQYTGTIVRLPRGEIVCDDALTFLNALRDECADIVFLDPPFNLGKRYGSRTEADDNLTDQKYFRYMTSILWRSCEVLRPGGALYLYHIPKWAMRFAQVLSSDLKFRHWIAISMKNGFVRPKHLHPAHYALLYYTKGEPHVFSRPRLPIAQCRKCGESIKDYGGYKKYVVDGVNLSDVWDDVSPVRHHKFKHREGNELPVKIPSRITEMSGRKGGVFIDPFAGTGTALVAAKKSGMYFVGCDKEKSYIDVMRRRIVGSK